MTSSGLLDVPRRIGISRVLGSLGLFAACLPIGVAGAEDSSAGSTVAGQVSAKRFYVSPMVSVAKADENRAADNGIGGALSLGMQLNDIVGVEISGFVTNFRGKSGGSASLTGAEASLLIFFLPEPWPKMFLLAGLGSGKGKSDFVTTPDQNRSSTLWDLGLGYLSGPFGFLNDGNLRFEVRLRTDEKTQGGGSIFTDGVASAGVLIPFGSAPARPAPVEPVQVVEPAEMPPPVVEEAPPPPPPPPPCKTPEPGEKVNLAGCGTGDVIVLRGVNFDFDKETLTPNAKTILNDVVEELKAYPEIKLQIGGHTDGKGSVTYNQGLSERRAKSVAAHLASQGLESERVTAVGYGESRPIDNNDTDEGRERNRRVELKITSGAAAPVADPETAQTPAPTEARVDE